MFCYQCEQTAKGEGCTTIGVCGKSAEVASLQDLLVYAIKGLSLVATEGRKKGISDEAVNTFTLKAIFSTLTNVDFDADRFVERIHQTATLRDELKGTVNRAGGNVDLANDAANFTPAATREGLVAQGEKI